LQAKLLDVNEKIVNHPGFVKNIDGRKAEVSIMVNSACSSCEIKGSCGISEAKEKIIEVNLSPAESYTEGQKVLVEMKQSLGSWAVLLGYFFPFLVVVISLFTLVSLGISEGVSALLSLSFLIPYYLVLYFTRDYFKKQFTYTIKSV
jgi:sigma-E factor negative regulatory protein RseC